MKIEPYIFFEGRTEEAIDFYAKAVGAKVETLMRYSDSPQPVPKDMLQSWSLSTFPPPRSWTFKAPTRWPCWRMNFGPRGFGSRRRKRARQCANACAGRASTRASEESAGSPRWQMWWTACRRPLN